jgi:uracil-DNA glycosylase
MRDIRGQQVDTKWGALIPTIHPASVLHQPGERPMLVEMLVEHLTRARHLAIGPED